MKHFKLLQANTIILALKGPLTKILINQKRKKSKLMGRDFNATLTGVSNVSINPLL